MRKYLPVTLLFLYIGFQTTGQTLGGTTVFNFLRFSSSPQSTALGGINTSQFTQDIAMAAGNPALVNASMNNQLSANFGSLKDGFRNYHIVVGHHREKLKTSFFGAVNFFDYGSILETDAAGNILGQIRPSEYIIQLGASRKYAEKFSYGAALKFAYSSYGSYRASGLALDFGVTYTDSSRFFRAGLVLKNMGIQTSGFPGAGRESLPFDIVLGVTKKLENAPLQFTLTTHHLHQFNIRYNDSSFNADNGFEEPGKTGFVDQLMRHFVFSTQLFISEKIEISAGYNYLRRKELNIGRNGNGLNGFSIGAGVLVKKIQIRYARTFYQSNFATNQIGLGISLNSFSELQK